MNDRLLNLVYRPRLGHKNVNVDPVAIRLLNGLLDLGLLHLLNKHHVNLAVLLDDCFNDRIDLVLVCEGQTILLHELMRVVYYDSWFDSATLVGGISHVAVVRHRVGHVVSAICAFFSVLDQLAVDDEAYQNDLTRLLDGHYRPKLLLITELIVLDRDIVVVPLKDESFQQNRHEYDLTPRLKVERVVDLSEDHQRFVSQWYIQNHGYVVHHNEYDIQHSVHANVL